MAFDIELIDILHDDEGSGNNDDYNEKWWR